MRAVLFMFCRPCLFVYLLIHITFLNYNVNVYTRLICCFYAVVYVLFL